MPNRAAKWLSAILGSIVAGFTFTAIAQAAGPAKDCLAAPGQPMPGGHWYYRIEHETKRHCWYVRGEIQGAAPASSSAQPAPPPGTPLQPSVADARAEMVSAAETVQPNDGNGSSPASVASGDNNSGPPPSSAPSRTLAERWSDHPNADNAAEAAPANVAAGVGQQPQPASAGQKADDPHAYSVWMLVGTLIGALALVGTATGLIAYFGPGSAIGGHDNGDGGRTIWGPQPVDDGLSSVDSGDQAPMNWIRTAREAQEAYRRAEQVEQVLSQSARRGTV